MNEVNGEANFDIDSDGEKCQLDLFEGKKLTKIEQFEQSLRNAVLSMDIRNNKEAYDFTINQGHLAKHADVVIRNLKKEKRISFDAKTPKCNYNQVYKNKVIVEYHVL